MKNIIIALVSLSSLSAFAAQKPLHRMFTVDFSTGNYEETAVKVCDDTYYGQVEIMVPSTTEAAVRAVVAEQCPSTRVLRAERIDTHRATYIRVRLDDNAWDCRFEFQGKDRARNPATYAIDLTDAC